jgi:hypothetical protein
VVRPPICVQDAHEALEFGAGRLEANEGTALDRMVSGFLIYLLSNQCCDLIDALLFLAPHFFGLLFTFKERVCVSYNLSCPRSLGFWTGF